MFSVCSNGITSIRNQKGTQSISKIKAFINKHNWDRIKHISELSVTGKCLRKTIDQLLLIFCTLNKCKCVSLIFQKFIWLWKTNNYLNDPKWWKRKPVLSCSKKNCIIERNNIDQDGDFIVWIAFNLLEQKSLQIWFFLWNCNAIRKG